MGSANFTELFQAQNQPSIFSKAISILENNVRGFNFSQLNKFRISSIMKGSGYNIFVRIGDTRHMIQSKTLELMSLQHAPIIRLPDDEILSIPKGDNFESLSFVKELNLLQQ